MAFPVFKISTIPDLIPTVNQLGEGIFGYNQTDALLYGLMKTTGGIKSVVCLNGLNTGVLPPDYIASVTDGMFDLGVTTGALKVEAFPSKKATAPGFPYFYLGTVAPTFSSRLNLDGSLYATSFWAEYSFMNELFLSQSAPSQFMLMQNSSVHMNSIKLQVDQGLTGMNSEPNPQGLSDSFRIFHGAPSLPSSSRGLSLQAYTTALNGTNTRLPIRFDVSDIYFPNGTPSKWIALDASKKIIYMNAPTPGAIPVDDMLHWDSVNSKYVPYAAKKGADPGFAYFYTNAGATAYPSYVNRVCLDAYLYVTMLVAGSSNNSVGLAQGSIALGDKNNSWSNGWSSNFGLYDIMGGMHLVSWATKSASEERSNRIKIGDYQATYGRVNENIVVDPANHRLEVNLQKTQFPYLTANKFLKLDANKELQCVEAPGGTSISIPKLKLETMHLSGYNDQLKCIWESNDMEFLGHNPEIWSYSYHKSNKKLTLTGERVIRRRWTHGSHLNGVKFSGGNFYAGCIDSVCSGIAVTGRHTEFTLTSASMEKQLIPVDPWDYFFGVLASDNSYVKLNDNYNWSLLSDFVLHPYKLHKMSIGLRFAIAIDNPFYVAGQNTPKLIGELSDIVFLRCRTETPTGSTIPRIRFHPDGVGVRMFGASRFG